jgi:hypothetical protein
MTKQLFFCSNYVGNQFIIAIRHLGVVIYGQYTTAKGSVQAVHVRTALSHGTLAIYHTPSGHIA